MRTSKSLLHETSDELAAEMCIVDLFAAQVARTPQGIDS